VRRFVTLDKGLREHPFDCHVHPRTVPTSVRPRSVSLRPAREIKCLTTQHAKTPNTHTDNMCLQLTASPPHAVVRLHRAFASQPDRLLPTALEAT